MNMQARETREALIAILTTAVSMGIDIDLLCHRSVEDILGHDAHEDVKPYAAGAIYQIGVCMNYVMEVPRPTDTEAPGPCSAPIRSLDGSLRPVQALWLA